MNLNLSAATRIGLYFVIALAIAVMLYLGATVLIPMTIAVLLAFGSAPTLFFWAKWLGKVVMAPPDAARVNERVALAENAALGPLALMTIAVCGLFPLVSSVFIAPYLQQV